ncbi:MAG TPA: hypothetical protein DCF63_20860, partial [Planctomycetaceae bacterium]|nr:hypothetical protein [Planctomycetaceae bacterium]
MTKTPERYGNYRMSRLIHTGANCEVWQAMSIDTNQPRAIKLQSVKSSSAAQAAKLLRHDYTVVNSCKHRNIIRVFDCGTDQGITYIGMERFSGRSLRQIFTEKDRNAIEAGLPLIVDQLCAALHQLHTSGWVYASLKPGHVLVNDQQQLRLIDFTHAQPMRGGLRLLSGTPKLVGSPYYFSPEQIRRQSLDSRSDVYSLGCLLYELIEGHVPFTGATPQELLNKHLQVKAPRITAKSKYVTDALVDLIGNMLAKEPAQRPDDMLIVRHELRRCFELADPVQWQTQFSGALVDDEAFASLTSSTSSRQKLDSQ